MLVELDIFSGRPNPTWELDEQAARTLRELHQELWGVDERPPEPPGLGYRGFVYTLNGRSWRAFNGWVFAPDRTTLDDGRTIERLLVRSLPDEYAELRSRLQAELR
jgi:hypothetical protein